MIGRRTYRGHEHNSTFFAKLSPFEERRAVARGAIALLERVTPSLTQVTYSLPKGWTNNEGGR